jgi:hypothetical protein
MTNEELQALKDEIQSLKDEIAAGNPVTQEQLDALDAMVSKLQGDTD